MFLGGYQHKGTPLNSPQNATQKVEFLKTNRKMCVFPDEGSKGPKLVLLIIT